MPSITRSSEQLRGFIRVGWIFAVLAVLGVGYAGHSYLRQREFVAHATRVQGTVVGNLRTISKRNDHYHAIFRFTDGTGKSWKVTDHSSDYRLRPFAFGEACTVLYDPADPAAAQLETTNGFLDTIGYAFVPGLVGLILGAVALFSLRKNYAELRQSLAAEDGTIPRDPAILSGP